MPAPAARPRLYLIDGYSNIFRAFYAIRALSTSKGESTNAVYGFVTMLRKLLREHTPELVGVALDVGGPTVRSAQYEEYKANRAPMPEDLRPQIAHVRAAIEAYRIPILETPEYEADDVLGTLACKAAEAGENAKFFHCSQLLVLSSWFARFGRLSPEDGFAASKDDFIASGRRSPP